MVLHLTSCVCLGPVHPSFIPPAYAARGLDGSKGRVLDIIRDNGGISRHSLTKKTQNLDATKRNAILSELVDSGKITVEIVNHDGAGRPGAWYYVA